MDKLIKFIYSTGDWNHAIISTSSMFVISMVLYFINSVFGFDINITIILSFIATAWSFLYLGKEHQSYIRLGDLKSFNMSKWQPRDRLQTILMWACVWVYAFGFEFVMDLF